MIPKPIRRHRSLVGYFTFQGCDILIARPQETYVFDMAMRDCGAIEMFFPAGMDRQQCNSELLGFGQCWRITSNEPPHSALVIV